MSKPSKKEAKDFIIKCLKDNTSRSYGYDIYVESLIRFYSERVLDTRCEDLKADRFKYDSTLNVFLDVLWELCLENFLRPSVSEGQIVISTDGSSYGYSLTSYGKEEFEIT